MIRWLAGREIDKDVTALTVTTDAAVYDRGQRVTIRVNRNPAAMVPGIPGASDGENGQDNKAGQHSSPCAPPDGRTTELSPTPSADPNAWTASYFPDRGGRFEADARLVADASGGSKDVANQAAEFFVHGSSLELSDPSSDPAALRNISTMTGGVYSDIDDTNSLDNLVRAMPSDQRVAYETKKAVVWNHPALFILFLACVTIEWVVRRRNQLVWAIAMDFSFYQAPGRQVFSRRAAKDRNLGRKPGKPVKELLKPIGAAESINLSPRWGLK